MVDTDEIERFYQELGYKLGWRFITCPEKNMTTAKLLLVTLNPAGREVHGPSWSQEEGSAYRVESWRGHPPGRAPLQRQVLQLFEFLCVRDDEVFSANSVPFRSVSWADLPERARAEQFAGQLWYSLRPHLVFDRLVCIGKDWPRRPIAEIVDARFETKLPVGWGAVTADKYRLPDGRPLVALPHLSRFTIFGRQSSAEPLRDLFYS
jgi:hypothetical protein